MYWNNKIYITIIVVGKNVIKDPVSRINQGCVFKSGEF